MKYRLYYGDNLDILRNREYFPDECVDLIYLDLPPQHGTFKQAARHRSGDGKSQRDLM